MGTVHGLVVTHWGQGSPGGGLLSSLVSKGRNIWGAVKGAVSNPLTLLKGALQLGWSGLKRFGNSNFVQAMGRLPVRLLDDAGSALVHKLPQWFDHGRGVLPTGTSVVHNGTGRPKPLISPDLLRSGPQIIINIDGALDPVAVGKQVARYVEQYTRNSHGVQQKIRSRR